MLFNSYSFLLIFLPIVVIGFYLFRYLKKESIVKIWLILASLFFYTYYTHKNLPLLVLSIAVNFLISRLILKKKEDKKLLIIGLSFNIILLAFFKYSGQFSWDIGSFSSKDIILPLGISFFTLQQISFLIDTYQGIIPKKNILDYTIFVSFFPHIISGPITKPREYMPQIESVHLNPFQIERINLGLFLIIIGLTKKVIIAEFFAPISKVGFDELQTLDFFLAWKTSLSYLFQLYYDFSGYSDMSIGIAHLFMLKLPQNFNSPFRSLSIIEFWTKWHISLSQFITTYIFTPIVRSFPAINLKYTLIATMISMFISGVWHGDKWTFVVYGILHGIALVINHIRKKQKKKLSTYLAWACTFIFINFALVIFRANDLKAASNIFKGMLGFSGIIIPKIGIKNLGFLANYGFSLGSYLYPKDYLYLVVIIFCFYSIFKYKSSFQLEKEFKPSTRLAILCGFGLTLSLLGMNTITEFIYFKF